MKHKQNEKWNKYWIASGKWTVNSEQCIRTAETKQLSKFIWQIFIEWYVRCYFKWHFPVNGDAMVPISRHFVVRYSPILWEIEMYRWENKEIVITFGSVKSRLFGLFFSSLYHHFFVWVVLIVICDIENSRLNKLPNVGQKWSYDIV